MCIRDRCVNDDILLQLKNLIQMVVGSKEQIIGFCDNWVINVIFCLCDDYVMYKHCDCVDYKPLVYAEADG